MSQKAIFVHKDVESVNAFCFREVSGLRAEGRFDALAEGVAVGEVHEAAACGGDVAEGDPGGEEGEGGAAEEVFVVAL